MSLPWVTSGWQRFGASVTPGSSKNTKIHPPSPLLSFLNTKIFGKQPCRLQLIARRDLSSLVFPKPSVQLLVSRSLRGRTGNICRREQTAEGGGRGGIVCAGKELQDEPAEQRHTQGRFPQQAPHCPGNPAPDKSPSPSYQLVLLSTGRD